MRSVRPWVWSILNAPFGATYGFVAVTLGYILKQEGLGDDEFAATLHASPACRNPRREESRRELARPGGTD